jgi:GMP synthase-like glutamine amidotransferase
MKPVAIFRHSPSEGPGYLAEFLDERDIPWQLIRIDANEPVPRDASDYAGLVFMGGPMSVNDDLPWIPPVLALIRDAVGRDVPLLGHCLGGQLMARALGAVVVRNLYKEIGWGKVTVADTDTARSWFGSVGSFDAFHWHGETFGLPLGAAKFLSSEHCYNQGFALGKHLALQCHIEMTADMITHWCELGADEIAASLGSPGVQTAADIQAQMAAKLPQLHEVAQRLYARWILGLSS